MSLFTGMTLCTLHLVPCLQLFLQTLIVSAAPLAMFFLTFLIVGIVVASLQYYAEKGTMVASKGCERIDCFVLQHTEYSALTTMCFSCIAL